METITITIYQDEVYEEVAKATDYTGAKLVDGDATARDRILATDADLATLGRFWDEATLAANDRLKQMLISGATKQVTEEEGDGDATKLTTKTAYVVQLEVSKAYDQNLNDSVAGSMKNYFIYSIIGQWFKFANKGEAGDYFTQAGDEITSAERMLYSRKRPTRPKV